MSTDQPTPREQHAEFDDRHHQKVHPCGCVTYYDTVQNRSRTLSACADHPVPPHPASLEAATRVGDTITTAEELDALPTRSVVADRDGDAWQRAQRWVSAMSSESPMDSLRLIGWYAPLTLLYRPDAPHPDYWVEEIAQWEGREQWEREAHPESYPQDAYDDRHQFRVQAHDALAAARAGEAMDREAVQRRIDLTLKQVARFEDRTAKTPGERESIIAALAEAQADVATLAARGDAAPGVTAAQVEMLARWHANEIAWSKRARPWADDSWAHVRRMFIDKIVIGLRKAGIEVRDA